MLIIEHSISKSLSSPYMESPKYLLFKFLCIIMGSSFKLRQIFEFNERYIWFCSLITQVRGIRPFDCILIILFYSIHINDQSRITDTLQNSLSLFLCVFVINFLLLIHNTCYLFLDNIKINLVILFILVSHQLKLSSLKKFYLLNNFLFFF